MRRDNFILLTLLLNFSAALMIGASFFSFIQWSKTLNVGRIQRQPGLSLEGCILTCWEEQQCKSINYWRHSTLCELNRLDSADPGADVTETDAGSIYSEKSTWTATEMTSICSRNSGAVDDCSKNSQSSFCSDPDLVFETEVVLGNMRTVGSKIRYACIISDSSEPLTIFPVGEAECQDNGNWSQVWRPCTEPDKNYALNKSAYQSTTFANAQGPSPASFAVDGDRYTMYTPERLFRCAQTEDINGWWYVDLETEVVVGNIVVYIRTDYNYTFSNQFQGMRFTVTDTEAQAQADQGTFCAFFEGPIIDIAENPVTVQCRIPQVGRFVRVTSTAGFKLGICELEVYTKLRRN